LTLIHVLNYLTLRSKVKFTVTTFLYLTLGHVLTHTKYESCQMKKSIIWTCSQKSRS